MFAEVPTFPSLLLERIAFIVLFYWALKFIAFLVSGKWDVVLLVGVILHAFGVRMVAEHTFEGKRRVTTPAGFIVEYLPTLHCRNIDRRFRTEVRMYDDSFQEHLVDAFTRNIFEPFLAESSYSFHLRTQSSTPDLLRRPIVVAHTFQNEQLHSREITMEELVTQARKIAPFQIEGCALELKNIEVEELSDELIEENYKMLSEEEKQTMMADPMFGRHSEALVVETLKRRLEFLKGGIKTHAAGNYSVTTQIIGRKLKMNWTLNSSAQGFSLVGFRSSDGFSQDQWSETGNGIRLVDSPRAGEVMELLEEGKAYFYTFFLKSWRDGTERDSLRFQLMVDSSKEKTLIEETLKQFEERMKPDPHKENLSKALKAISSYMEMDTAFEAMQKSGIEQIQKSSLSESDKDEKVERLREVVRQIRSDYDP